MVDRKHPSVAVWITVATLAVLVLYPLSIGPACWLTTRHIIPTPCKPIELFYFPLNWIVFKSETATRVYLWYIGLWVEPSGQTAKLLPVSPPSIVMR